MSNKNVVSSSSTFKLAITLVTSLATISGCVSPQDVERTSEAAGRPGDEPGGKVRPVQASGTAAKGERIVSQDGAPLNDQKAGGPQSVIPGIAVATQKKAAPVSAAPKPKSASVDAVIPPLPLAQFVDLVFGEMLGVPYTVGAGLAGRTDLVQLRSSGKLSSENFLELVSAGLKSYGVAVVLENGAYNIVEDKVLKSQIPRFIHSRANASTPSDLRPIFTFAELKAVSANDMLEILKKAFPGSDTIKFEANQRLNTITLTGLSRDVDAALAIIAQMDELTFADTTVERYKPTYWVAGDLARELNKLLTAEGWQSSDNTAVPRTIMILPIAFSNNLVVFAKHPAALARARFWLSELDRPSQVGDVPQLFIYQVRNVDAKILADTVNSLSGPRGVASQIVSPAGAPAPALATPQPDIGFRPGGGNSPASPQRGALVVDVMSNQLIFSGTPSDYDRMLPLLQQLDRPPGEVLIQVSIVEVTLTDETRLGIEFFLDNVAASGNGLEVSTDGLGLGSDGLNISVLSGDVNASLNAFAKNNQINILSRPRLIARSGSAAQIQVGTDVPIITSQRAAGSQDGVGNTDILQSVQYRSTGVLLSIEPIIFSQDRVNLKISQEVSSALGATGGISSPRISTRNINTELSLEDGETVVLGGLMQSDATVDVTGVPFLKDIPLLGGLFSSESASTNHTELLVLISAYILRGPEDKAFFTDSFVDQLNQKSSDPSNLVTRVTPDYRSLTLPSPAPSASENRGN